MAKQQLKKPTESVKKKGSKNCEEIKKCIDDGVGSLRQELIPRIDLLDKRDKEQYDSAKKIITDANDLMMSRQKHSEKVVESVKQEIGIMITKQDEVIEKLHTSLRSLHTKLDDHVTDENRTFSEMRVTLRDIGEHGTKLARTIDEKLNTIKVNGGVYPLGEAFQHIYEQHSATHKKLNEVVALVEPLRLRRTWISSTKELIAKNGFFHFIFSTKTGAILTLMTLLLIVNSVLTDVFHVNFDIASIFKWLAGLLRN